MANASNTPSMAAIKAILGERKRDKIAQVALEHLQKLCKLTKRMNKNL
jgi:hypothetical protein